MSRRFALVVESVRPRPRFAASAAPASSIDVDVQQHPRTDKAQCGEREPERDHPNRVSVYCSERAVTRHHVPGPQPRQSVKGLLGFLPLSKRRFRAMVYDADYQLIRVADDGRNLPGRTARHTPPINLLDLAAPQGRDRARSIDEKVAADDDGAGADRRFRPIPEFFIAHADVAVDPGPADRRRWPARRALACFHAVDGTGSGDSCRSATIAVIEGVCPRRRQRVRDGVRHALCRRFGKARFGQPEVARGDHPGRRRHAAAAPRWSAGGGPSR